jgi:hypothetical protein
MEIGLVPLCTMHIVVKAPIEIGAGPAGTRRIIENVSAQIKGERLNAEQLGVAASDWLVVGPEGTGMVDVRLAIQTDDGAAIYMKYNGRFNASPGSQDPATVYAAPTFETGDERYAWLNRVQAVGKGIIRPDRTIDYEFYEVR